MILTASGRRRQCLKACCDSTQVYLASHIFRKSSVSVIGVSYHLMMQPQLKMLELALKLLLVRSVSRPLLVT